MLNFAAIANQLGTIEVSPKNPAVIAQDLIMNGANGSVTIKAPFSKQKFMVTNTSGQTLFIEKGDIIITGTGGSSTTSFSFPDAVEIADGDTFETGDTYLEAMPVTTADYVVEITLSGKLADGKALSLSIEFKAIR